jgi:hypothetical protein
MPFTAAVNSRRKRSWQSDSVSKSEDVPPGAENEQGYYHARPDFNPVPKTKPGDYMHATFSVPKRSSVPLFHRLLDFAHVVVHHAAMQTLDCLLSVYIG